MSLELVILAPDRMIVEARIPGLQAADASGQFGLRSGHEDFMTVLVPCVMRYQLEPGPESFAAVDGGVLLLERGRISIVTRDAVISERIDQVADAAAEMLAARRAREQAARSGFAELEITLLHDRRPARRGAPANPRRRAPPFARRMGRRRGRCRRDGRRAQR